MTPKIRSLDSFFERWIYSSSLPRLTYRYQVDGQQLVFKVDQIGDVFDVPITFTLRYTDGKSADVVVPVTQQSAEVRVPLTGSLRDVNVSKNDISLAEIKVVQ